MTLSDGDDAPSGDTWFRIATHPDHIKNGRPHHSAFTGNALSKSKDRRPWARELSGRLRSKAGDNESVIDHGRRYCAKLGNNRVFAGIMFAPSNNLRSSYTANGHQIETNVSYTPLPNDDAHADLTFTPWTIPEGQSEEDKSQRQEFYSWLGDHLQVLLDNTRSTGQNQIRQFLPAAIDLEAMSAAIDAVQADDATAGKISPSGVSHSASVPPDQPDQVS